MKPVFWQSLVAILLSACAVFAQGTTAQIVGRIFDPSGSAVPGALIKVTNVDNGSAREAQSNDSGSYVLPLLLPGNYRLMITKDGFRPVSRTGITLLVDQVVRIDQELELGSIAQEVQVSATAAALEQDTSALGQIVDSSKLQSMPLNGRSTFRLVQLTPGVLSTPSASGQFGDVPVNTVFDSSFSVNGGRHGSNEILVDGVPATSGFLNQITTIPSVEATQEFKVQSSGMSAEYGRFGGGVMNVSTRSGTNQLHGSMFEFLRNSALDANEFFNNRAGRQKPPFRMNQFGFAAGGPVWLGKLYDGRNRTFFFGDYQGTRWTRGDVFSASVPTALERTADFSRSLDNQGRMINVFDPTTTRRDPANAAQFIRSPFPGNRIPDSRMDPVGKAIVGFYPAPTSAGDPLTQLNNFGSNAARTVNVNQGSIRIDHNFSERYRVFGRYARVGTDLAQPDYFGNEATGGAGAAGRTPFHQQTAGFDQSIILNPQTVLSVRFGFARWYQLRATRGYGFDQKKLGLPASLVSQFQIPVFPSMAIEGYAAMANNNYLSNGNDTYSLLSSVSLLRGKHNLKIGGDVRQRRLNFFQLVNGGGGYTINRVLTRGPNPNVVAANAGHAIASLLLGVGSGTVNMAAGNSLLQWYTAGYVQDDIRVSTRLTLNLGLRYETESPFTERRNQLAWFDTAVASPVTNTQFPKLLGGLDFSKPGSRHIFNWDRNNISPRAGLAFTLNQKTVLRAGAGLFYATPEYATNATGFTPDAGFSSVTQFVGSLDNLTPFDYLQNPFPSGLQQPSRQTLGAATQLGQSLNLWDARIRTPYSIQWNLNIQRQLPGALLVDAAYSANRGVALSRQFDIDALDPKFLSLGTGLQQLVSNPFAGKITSGSLAQAQVQARQLLLPYPQFTGVTLVNSTIGNSIYHSFQIKLERRLSRGAGFLLAYTAGKLISDVPNSLGTVGTQQNNAVAVQNPYDLRSERSVAGMDVSQSFTLSGVFELPFGPNQRWLSNVKGFAARFIQGWQLNGITTYRTGFPLVVTVPAVPGGGNRPNSTGRSSGLSNDRSRAEKIDRWFDTSAFTIPAAFTFGNVSRTLPDVRGPAMLNFDVSLFKNTRLTERVMLQFRAESFNVANAPHFWLPNTALGNLQAGRITETTALPRVNQLALKLIF